MDVRFERAEFSNPFCISTVCTSMAGTFMKCHLRPIPPQGHPQDSGNISQVRVQHITELMVRIVSRFLSHGSDHFLD